MGEAPFFEGEQKQEPNCVDYETCDDGQHGVEEVEVFGGEPVHGLRGQGPLGCHHFFRNEMQKPNSSELRDCFPEGQRKQVVANVDMQVDELHGDEVLFDDDAVACQNSHEHADDGHPGQHLEENAELGNIFELLVGVGVESWDVDVADDLSSSCLQPPGDTHLFDGNSSIDETSADVDDQNQILLVVVAIDQIVVVGGDGCYFKVKESLDGWYIFY